MQPSLVRPLRTHTVRKIDGSYILAVDENMTGTIPFLEYVGHNVLRPERGEDDDSIHDALNGIADEEHNPRRVVFFTQDRGFAKRENRKYYLYLMQMPKARDALRSSDQARLIEIILAQDLPKRVDAQFEITVTHYFRTLERGVVEVESAMPHMNDNG